MSLCEFSDQGLDLCLLTWVVRQIFEACISIYVDSTRFFDFGMTRCTFIAAVSSNAIHKRRNSSTTCKKESHTAYLIFEASQTAR